MAQQTTFTLMKSLEGVPDPRNARGKQFEWSYLLAIIGAALVSGQKTCRAIAHWAVLHADEIMALLQPSAERIPSFATFYRALRKVDVEALEKQMADYGQGVDQEDPLSGRIAGPNGEVLQGQAADGKVLKGASAHGELVTLVSLVRHGSGIVLGEQRVAAHSNEIPTAQALLTGRNLSGTVTTLDAFHTQRLTAQQILDQGGHYLMIVKSNQAELRNAIALLFDSVPLRGENDRLEYIYPGVGHGRLEKRSLTSTCGLGNYLNWPGACQVLRRECQRINRKSGKVEVEVTYGITDLSREQALPIHIEFFWRGHWTIENRTHYVRDETMGEDRCQTHCGSSAQALAALRNGILSMFRYEGWENIAAAIRHFGSSVQKALSIIGAIAT